MPNDPPPTITNGAIPQMLRSTGRKPYFLFVLGIHHRPSYDVVNFLGIQLAYTKLLLPPQMTLPRVSGYNPLPPQLRDLPDPGPSGHCRPESTTQALLVCHIKLEGLQETIKKPASTASVLGNQATLTWAIDISCS